MYSCTQCTAYVCYYQTLWENRCMVCQYLYLKHKFSLSSFITFGFPHLTIFGIISQRNAMNVSVCPDIWKLFVYVAQTIAHFYVNSFCRSCMFGVFILAMSWFLLPGTFNTIQQLFANVEINVFWEYNAGEHSVQNKFIVRKDVDKEGVPFFGKGLFLYIYNFHISKFMSRKSKTAK